MKLAVLLVPALLATGALAGCLADPLESSTLPGTPERALLPGDEGAHWSGGKLAALESDWSWDASCLVQGCPRPEVPCEPSNCERIPFRVDVPSGWWDEQDGALVVSIAWDDWEGWPWFEVEVFDAAGRSLGLGRGALASVFVLDRPEPGAYEAVVKAHWGEGTYEGHVAVESRPKAEGPARDLMPNLVTLPPRDLRIETPSQWTCVPFLLCRTLPADPVLHAAGVRGCSTYEVVESEGRRCLRFSNAIGNTGEGPLEVRLTFAEGLKGMAGAGTHVQRIHRSDGTWRDVEAGPAEFHATHGHFHYDGMTEFFVHRYDLETRTRGELVNAGTKAGICLVDIGLVDLGAVGTRQPNWDVTCFYPLWATLWQPTADLSMSLSPNWFDLYVWSLDDMFVDMTGVPDGVYELVSATNRAATAVESDTADNDASVVFRLTGDDVEVLFETSGHGVTGA